MDLEDKRRTPVSTGTPTAIRAIYSLLAFFLLALLAKTSVVMLPAVLLLCAWWRRGKVAARDLLRGCRSSRCRWRWVVTVWYQYQSDIAGGVPRTTPGRARGGRGLGGLVLPLQGAAAGEPEFHLSPLAD